MSSSDCALYAELLANIRQISLATSLSSPCDASTRVAVLADCRTVELRHHNSIHLLTLPAKTALGGTLLPIQDKQRGSTFLSWRLPLDASAVSPSHHLDEVVWSATDLDPKSGVACRQCSTDIVCPGSVKAWKDLPSENWAEMMEFWHCHKPDHHHHNTGEETGKAGEESLAARGYGASSAISAQEGVGFVDLTTLLFEERDCQNLTVSLALSGIRPTLPLFSYYELLEGVFVMGIKKVAKPAHKASMEWIPIQMPQINFMAHLPVHAGYRVSEPPSGDGSSPPADSLPSALRQIILKLRLLWDYWRDIHTWHDALKIPSQSVADRFWFIVLSVYF